MTGACPHDPVDVRCCIQKTCKSGTGNCLDNEVASCPGHFEAGFCPGPNNVQCCVQNCPAYWVIGVRGSEEPDGTGFNGDIAEMGETLEKYVAHSAEILPADTEYLGLPYPADLTSLPTFLDSEETGWKALQAIIKTRVKGCPKIKIGLAGYSQGAAVVNDALHFLSTDAPNTLDNIHAVMLLADPKADPSQSYHAMITEDGLPAGKTTDDGILGAQALPSQVRSSASSLCIQGDIVCDTAKSLPGLVIEGMTAAIHLTYINCCIEFLFPSILGGQLANRLLA